MPTARRLVALFALLALPLVAPATAVAQTAAAAPARAATTVVYIVRHAEKAAEPASDPALTPDGEARAQELARVLENAGVTAIVTTQFARTRLTAKPLADKLGVTSEVVDARAQGHAAAVARAVMEKHAGETVLVVGHSNTIPDIAAALGAAHPGVIADATYDNLYVVTVGADGKAKIAKARYGKP